MISDEASVKCMYLIRRRQQAIDIWGPVGSSHMRAIRGKSGEVRSVVFHDDDAIKSGNYPPRLLDSSTPRPRPCPRPSSFSYD